jgi:cytochrome c556
MKKILVIIAVILVVVLLACCLAGAVYLLNRRNQQRQSALGFKDVYNQYIAAANKVNTKLDEFSTLEQERNTLVDKMEAAANAGDNTEVLKAIDDVEANVDKQQSLVDEINTAVMQENGLVMRLASESAKVEPVSLKSSSANLAVKAAEGNAVENDFRTLLQTSIDIDRKFITTYRNAANGSITTDEFKTENMEEDKELDENNAARNVKAAEYRRLRDEIRQEWLAVQRNI